ncbi:MAG TPA: DUF3616 domain-containing protein [Bradyrhizobium sp.]|nr:DUF3616 domain-containing protein [Bradyrhizobium sp.]
MRTTLLAAALILVGCPIGQCLASSIDLKPLKVVGKFEGKKGKAAVDISGVSCLAPQDGKRTCLLVNDENKNAQFATLDDNKGELTVGDTVTLIGKDPSPDTLGRAPDVNCKGGNDGFKDLDGEGVAYADPYFYVIGSHGCSRKQDEFRLSSFILARVGPASAHTVTTTYRVSDLLAKSDEVKSFFGKDLERGNGLNIEGVAATGDTLWVGLRAPVTGDAYLVSGSISELFRDGHDPAVTAAHTVAIKLDERGIRDLSALPDGRLLVLAGPAQDADQSFKLYVADSAKGTKEELGTLEDIEDGKAEGLTVLEVSGNKAKILVVFDGLKNGDPRIGEVELPH